MFRVSFTADVGMVLVLLVPNQGKVIAFVFFVAWELWLT